MSNQTDNSRKRPRTRSAKPIPPEALERYEEFWLEDGNIVLVAQNVAFRVYQGLLTKQSAVFKDLFSSAETRADETYDGVPVVRLFDSPVELRHLFRVLLPTSQQTAMKDTYDMETEFHVLSALIRLSHKYQIEEIEARGIRALRAMYPTDLNSFMAVENHVNEESFVHAIGAINIARLTGTPSILPAAFYHCAVLREKVIKGLVREDGTKEYLSEQDLARCIRGIERLAAEFAAWCLSLSMNSLKPGQWGCKSEARCKDPGASIVAKMIRAITHRSITAEALSGFDFSGTKDMCSACVNRFEGEEQRAREKVWQRLPLTFNLAAELPWWPNEPDEAA